MPDQLPPEIIASIVGGYNGDPFAVLGPHPISVDEQPAVAIRTFLPWASSVQVVEHDGTAHEMRRIHPDGLFEAIIPVGVRGEGYGIINTPLTPHPSPLHYTLRATN